MNLTDDWSTDTVRANGIDVHYYRTGTRDGPPVVLAHGFTDNGRCWSPLAADLADLGYDVVAPDARGHGRSSVPDTGNTAADRVDDLVGLIDALELSNPVLIGHSMGGTTAAWTAATHPDLPRGLVLEDPAGMLEDARETAPDDAVCGMRQQIRAWQDQSLEETMADIDREPELAEILATARTECSESIAEVIREGFSHPREAFAEVTCPTLILKADADPDAQADHRETAAALADGRLVHVDGAGHCVFRDRYDAAFGELAGFLDDLEFE
ncbi:alpha/beta hydrolase [Halobacteria archaeon AArc-m2/3/4]|uniref:Alpha/beta hydrolase n=1 Tax=Natronoglomus mannanivorans TaxID=2979990 RepID=A0AAP2YXD4_9EURY|nr:alpha/beta hydrolase [Halobacteria archaeon AArc-xg1-1]MCU4972437.1 alpha/beta hydrolase [Halobacteria archaeon AArc-m2/3/4]